MGLIFMVVVAATTQPSRSLGDVYEAVQMAQGYNPRWGAANRCP